MNEIVVANLPVAAIWIIAIFQMLVALAVVGVLALFGGQLRPILSDLRSTLKDLRCETMPSVLETLRHIQNVSDEAKRTTHDIAGRVDKISAVVAAIATRAESPVVRGAGLLSGAVTGLRFVGAEKRAQKARQKAEYAKPKKVTKRGLFRSTR